MIYLPSFPRGGVAVVVGASGGIGAALRDAIGLCGAFEGTLGLSRQSTPSLDLRDEASIAGCACHAASLGPVRLVIDATGLLHGDGLQPEKSWRQIDADAMAEAFAVNTIGPALLMKHFLPLLPATGKSVFATLSARVGSIGDNRLGGWYSYRSSKAALNQLVRTASIELKRRQREALCVALHPGTVSTPLSEPFGKSGLELQTPSQAASRLLEVVNRLGPADSGGFFDHQGESVPW